MRFALATRLSCLLLMAAVPSVAVADVLISIDKASQRMSVSVNGQQRFAWPVSTCASSYDTPSGSFRPLRMEREHFSREWDDAPMPYSIFFTPDGHAIHGTNHARQLGRPASHGCVRLAPRHAATLFALVRAEGIGTTQVVIEGDDAVSAHDGGFGTGVDPLAALQRSVSARSKWQAVTKVSSSSAANSVDSNAGAEGAASTSLSASKASAGLTGAAVGPAPQVPPPEAR